MSEIKNKGYLNYKDFDSDEFYELAYKEWQFRYTHGDIDRRLIPFLMVEQNKNWLKNAREALFLSAEQVAEKSEFSISAYYKIEKSEELGTISLNTLEKVAEAMDCELVYAIRPKQKVLFSCVLWKQITNILAPKLHMPPRGYGSFLALNADNPRFRKKLNWSNRTRKLRK